MTCTSKFIHCSYLYSQGRLYYRVKWLGYKSNENSWVPVEDLNCQRKVDEYEKKGISSSISSRLLQYSFLAIHKQTLTKNCHYAVKSEQVIRVEEEALGEESILCTIDFGFFSSKILKRNENNQCWPKANAADGIPPSPSSSYLLPISDINIRYQMWSNQRQVQISERSSGGFFITGIQGRGERKETRERRGERSEDRGDEGREMRKKSSQRSD